MGRFVETGLMQTGSAIPPQPQEDNWLFATFLTFLICDLFVTFLTNFVMLSLVDRLKL